MGQAVTVLGIETSCDETAAAVLRLEDGRVTLLADVIRTQLEEHAPYQGVVPEIAARAHAELVDLTVAAALHDSRTVERLVQQLIDLLLSRVSGGLHRRFGFDAFW